MTGRRSGARRRVTPWLGVGALALVGALVASTATTSAAWNDPAFARATVATLASGTTVRIKSTDGSVCLDNRSNGGGTATASTQQVTARTCANVNSQKWTVNWDSTIRTAGFTTTYCLDVDSEGTANGTAAIVYTCKTTGNLTNQHWTVWSASAAGQAWETGQAGTPAGNDRCVSAALNGGGTVTSPTNVVLWTCGASGYQQTWVVATWP
ncbi:RICIN domain-containing protein [Cellulomonas alba]|uniref:Ricin-type beta-trefoil lectin domain protein n=1 Tax=Cellulomonas alba TaxID=3053467 RepID=A0ABT7SGW7_9CELL|nr:ricin-type beta-trefoil lectin domain protein [Cellulomonas alba]MDM7855423.1 ricin-type beta-trefoil lectin domain protein [Cellulomonas alba]